MLELLRGRETHLVMPAAGSRIRSDGLGTNRDCGASSQILTSQTDRLGSATASV